MPAVRPAVESDIAEVVRLRVVFFESLGGDFFNPPAGDSGWQDAMVGVVRRHLDSDVMRILVADGGNGLAACGFGTIEQWVPSPRLPDGRIGHVLGMVTDPAHRRQGHARAVMDGLLTWFDEREVRRVDLHASAEGEPLYRSLGFTTHPDPSLSRLA